MTVFQTVAVAFGMFSALPVPKTEWTERNMCYALCAFPLIGLVIGLLLWAVICVLTILYKSHQAERHDQRYTPKGTIIGFLGAPPSPMVLAMGMPRSM